jgi:hypothetical protein
MIVYLICRITGFEGMGRDINAVSDDIVYPSRLKLFTYPRAILSDFPSPERNPDGDSGELLFCSGFETIPDYHH